MMVENIALKEIERNPIDFMKRESFQVAGNEEFYSFCGDGGEINDNKMLNAEEESEEDDEEDEDVSDQEYHTEENTVGKRIIPYKQPNAHEESKHPVETLTKNEIASNNIKEIEEIFHESVAQHSKNSPDKSLRPQMIIEEEELKHSERSNLLKDEEEEMDPPERFILPYFKDPKLKISIWTILKDSMGKDITKMSVPVYFNDPMNILQKCATSMEYVDLLDGAVAHPDSLKRLAIVAAYVITNLTCLERNSTKPFNPLLGETFELVTDKYKFLAEQVSHHPPITAIDCQGKSGYHVWSCNRGKTKFNAKGLSF